MKPYTALLEECIKMGLPKHYLNDVLKHDKESILSLACNNEIIKFGWSLRDCGSHMFGCGLNNSVTEMALEWEWSWIRACSQYKNQHWYWWNGTELCDSSPNEIINNLKKEFSSEQV